MDLYLNLFDSEFASAPDLCSLSHAASDGEELLDVQKHVRFPLLCMMVHSTNCRWACAVARSSFVRSQFSRDNKGK
jgi:hypothetical protein